MIKIVCNCECKCKEEVAPLITWLRENLTDKQLHIALIVMLSLFILLMGLVLSIKGDNE